MNCLRLFMITVILLGVAACTTSGVSHMTGGIGLRGKCQSSCQSSLITQAKGIAPPPSPFPSTTMSGMTSKCSNAKKRPVMHEDGVASTRILSSEHSRAKC